MSISAIDAPIIVHTNAPGGGVEYTNPDPAPSGFVYGYGIMDPRTGFNYVPGMAQSEPCYMWVGTDFLVCSQVPSTISAVNIAASQSPGAAALTLVSSSGAGITVGVTVTNATTGLAVAGLLAIDGAMGGVLFGQSSTTSSVTAWDPTKSISRALRITSGGNDSGITFNVRGYDLYGYPMSENITGANAGIATGLKAWKYIASITPSAAAATTVTVGTADIFGFPLRTDLFGYSQINWNNAWITASTGFVVPDATSPATVSTGDVRGTYAVQSASDATKRLVMYTQIPPANLKTPVATGMYGVAQV